MIDPICGMEVEPSKAAGNQVYNGQTYFFCSHHCLAKFKGDPEKFLKSPGNVHAAHGHEHGPEHVAAQAVQTDRAKNITYVCPMALEPRTVTLEEEANPELIDMTRRFWVGVVLSVPIALLAMSDMIPGQPVQQIVSPQLLNWLQLVLATPVVLWCGWPFFQRGWASIINRSLNMFTLIAIGVGTAYVYSVVATFFPYLFPTSFRGHSGEVGVYFDAAAVITTLVLLGQVLELRARSKTSKAIKALLGLAPKTA